MERALERGWHLVADERDLRDPGSCRVASLLDEPLLLTRDDKGELHALSNVCTHRGAILCEADRKAGPLQCAYHGRRFALDGKCLGAPGFQGALEALPAVPFARWRRFLFASVEPAHGLDALVAEMEARIGWLPIEQAVLQRSQDFEVAANWVLYCDNYLEGLHIPFVHAALAKALDGESYRIELFPHASLQTGIAAEGEPAFDLPPSSPDFGKRVAGYYFWLFPCTMFNVYPWGISLNVVKPRAADRTTVSFLTYVWDRGKLEQGAGSGLQRVELEDEAVVQSVQRGSSSRLFRPGRYAPGHEDGVRHFHELLHA